MYTPDPNQQHPSILILNLEAQQHRALRELAIANAATPVDTASATTALGYLTTINNQIIALRAQLAGT